VAVGPPFGFGLVVAIDGKERDLDSICVETLATVSSPRWLRRTVLSPIGSPSRMTVKFIVPLSGQPAVGDANTAAGATTNPKTSPRLAKSRANVRIPHPRVMPDSKADESGIFVSQIARIGGRRRRPAAVSDTILGT
jgi:hypothetical protein